MSDMSKNRGRNFLFYCHAGCDSNTGCFAGVESDGNKGETKNSAEGAAAASSSSAPSGGGQQTSTPPTGRGDHKCDVAVASEKEFSVEAPSDYRFKKTYDGIKYPVSATYGPTYSAWCCGILLCS